MAITRPVANAISMGRSRRLPMPTYSGSDSPSGSSSAAIVDMMNSLTLAGDARAQRRPRGLQTYCPAVSLESEGIEEAHRVGGALILQLQRQGHSRSLLPVESQMRFRIRAVGKCEGDEGRRERARVVVYLGFRRERKPLRKQVAR